jgi:Domain of unknown function (DUF5060)
MRRGAGLAMFVCAASLGAVLATVHEWWAMELEFHSTSRYPNPFTDVELTCTLTLGRVEKVLALGGFIKESDPARRRRSVPRMSGSPISALAARRRFHPGQTAKTGC